LNFKKGKKMFYTLQQVWSKFTEKSERPTSDTQTFLKRFNGRRRQFVVIGMGRFGSSVAETLVQFGHDVLAIDADIERVQHLSSELPHVIQLDATNAEALEQIGISSFDTGVVAISNDFESKLLATVHLRRFGVRHVITKARTRTQKTILESIGAHEVILPEHDAGVHWGRRLAFNHFVDYLEIGKGVGIVEITAPTHICGQSLLECNLRQKHGLTVIAVHRGEEVIVSPAADFRIKSGDVLAVVGRMEDAEKMNG
jgi:trk system potassium uptake protein TrkA